MSASTDQLLAGAAHVDHDSERSIREFFAREGRLAGVSWNAFWTEFDKTRHLDHDYHAALRIFVARYELFLKEGA
jgi:hypothetical protein